MFDFFQRQRFFIFGLLVALCVGGIVAVNGLPVEPVPDISPRQVMVSATVPGLATEEVEKLLTFPMEVSFTGLPGVIDLRSVSRTGVAVVYLQFEDHTNIDFDRTLVAERLTTARDNIAVPHVSIQMGPRATGMGEIMQFQLVGPGYSLMDLNRVLQWNVIPQLKLLPGVADVNGNGGAEETYQVVLDPVRLRAYNVSVPEVYSAMDANNASAGGGWINHHAEQQVIIGRALINDLPSLGMIPVKMGKNGSVVRVKDVGRVVLGPRTRLGAATRDGKGEAVIGVVLMQDGASSNAVLSKINKTLPQIQHSLPPGMKIVPYYERSVLTEETISTVKENLVIGAFLVLFVLIVVLGDWRAALVISSAIPVALLCAFIGMRIFGVSANLLSLGAIDFGMIVDSSLVIIEHFLTIRQVEGEQRSVKDAAVQSARLVIRPVTFSIFVIIAVYLPILSLQGIEGKMFRPMAETVVMGLLTSLVYCFVCIPVLATVFLRHPVSEDHETRFIRFLRKYYDPALLWTEQHSRTVILGTTLLFILSMGLTFRLGGEFVPTLEEGSLAVAATRLPSASLDTVIEGVTREEKIIRSFPEVKTVVSNIGTAAIPTDPMGQNEADSFIILKPRSQWGSHHTTQSDLVRDMSAALKEKVPSASYEWSQPIQMRMDDLLSGVRTQLAISIYGDDLDELNGLAEQVSSVVNSVPGAADVALLGGGVMPFLHLDVDRDAAARYGVAVSDILDEITAIGGYVGKSVILNNSIIPVQVSLAHISVNSISKIEKLPIHRADGHGWVPLGSVCKVVSVDGWTRIDRDRVHRRIIVQANVRGRDVSSFVSQAQQAVQDKVKMPPGYQIVWAGQFQNLRSAVARLLLVLPIAFAVIFALLIAALGSVKASSLVFINLPIAATGGILALYVRGMPFSIAAGIGFIALFGVAILNGVVLVSQIRIFEKEGMNIRQASLEAAKARFRPVMATASVASLGFFPMAFSGSMGAEVEKPLATVVIGGLITSTLLTLIVFPTLYARVFKTVE
ncbi:efflux RND transporter permease subunit [Swingsia samuiensis]|uniref:Efflux RND transporter permease subunit n=1 Tax=Swingsia samuiensis TaxID=1293412 RepID=A0A4Y6UFL8_9PROT|nr:CusA/CzcA family heavy metal efflux RND transporter [Swingsia samuiensis]QDH16343.1 efflux RND transporter permease subunit [Swingsia samuiensis]